MQAVAGAVIEGYEHRDLVEAIFRKTVAYEPAGDWPLIADTKTVLDFGGGAGLHYKVARQQTVDVRWAVVETPTMVRRASELATDRLRFFDSLKEAADWLGAVDLMHSNGAIQYVPNAIETFRGLCAAQPARMVWYRVPIGEADAEPEVQTSYLSDNGPGSLGIAKDKLVKYTRRRISRQAFVAAHEGYRIVECGSDPRERGTQQFRFVRA
ncbi:hypothetical protein JQ596_39030 [Bradyrhizobium manausense]|uniref:hypothetical protein n=1 Tax=Bradyrhizobium TaxID=374 RepID=UPI001BA734AB|nr:MULTISPECIES: hypothetical protein [Bradyrhizobium]MBR0831516.1 hypothetical protein [Bradyrhizobium manausense]UVO27105.1 hypothetical protein KUF59_31965 [Bradyrhizobium arachidis]